MSAVAPISRNLEFVNYRDLSHVDLVRACSSSRDERVWDEFVSRYNRFICLSVLRAYCQRGGQRYRSVDVDLINDLVQEVYLKVFESTRGALKGFRGENDAAVFVYIGRVALSVVVDHLRRNGAIKRGTETISLDATISDEEGHEISLADRLVAPGATPEQEAVASILRAQVTQILTGSLRGRNADRDAEIAEAFIFDGCSLAEIAERFEGRMRESGIKSSIRRTSIRLRGEISRLERFAGSYRVPAAAAR